MKSTFGADLRVKLESRIGADPALVRELESRRKLRAMTILLDAGPGAATVLIPIAAALVLDLESLFAGAAELAFTAPLAAAGWMHLRFWGDATRLGDRHLRGELHLAGIDAPTWLYANLRRRVIMLLSPIWLGAPVQAVIALAFFFTVISPNNDGTVPYLLMIGIAVIHYQTCAALAGLIAVLDLIHREKGRIDTLARGLHFGVLCAVLVGTPVIIVVSLASLISDPNSEDFMVFLIMPLVCHAVAWFFPWRLRSRWIILCHDYFKFE